MFYKNVKKHKLVCNSGLNVNELIMTIFIEENFKVENNETQGYGINFESFHL